MDGSIEELFEQNADMRLLELRHTGSAAVAKPPRQNAAFGAESILPGGTADAATTTGPRLRLAVTALPKAGLIAGTVVGIAIDVFNDGDDAAPEMLLQLSLPIETEFRRGSLAVDGREPTSAERLFGDGLWLPRLVGLAATKVTLQLTVLAGLSSIFLQPQLHASGVPIVGTPGVALKRGSTATLARSTPAKAFYELEDDELDETTIPESASAIVPPAPEPPAPRAPAPPTLASASVSAVAATPVPARAPEPERADPTPEPPTPPVAAPVAEPLRYRALDPPGLAFVERLFANERASANAHFALLATIACTKSAAGTDVGGIDAVARADLSYLARAIVLERMGKSAPSTYDNATLADLSLIAPTPGTPKSNLRLSGSLRPNEANAIGALLPASTRDAGLRLRVVFAALAATAIDGIPVDALAEYRLSALGWLVPLCVSSADGTAAKRPLVPSAALDTAAREALAALRVALDL